MIATRNMLRLGRAALSIRPVEQRPWRDHGKSANLAGDLLAAAASEPVPPSLIASASKTLENKTQPSGLKTNK
jgi:hypothetical protein